MKIVIDWDNEDSSVRSLPASTLRSILVFSSTCLQGLTWLVVKSVSRVLPGEDADIVVLSVCLKAEVQIDGNTRWKEFARIIQYI